MKRLRRMAGMIALLVASSMVIAACSLGRQPVEDDGAAAAQEVNGELGVVLSLSGENTAYGSSSRAGIELATADLEDEEHGPDGVSISASFLDDEGDPETAAIRFQEHIDNGATTTMGPTLSNAAFEADPVAQDAGVPVVAVSNTAKGITEIGDYIFRVSLAEADVVPQTMDAIAESYGPESAALVYSGDDAWSSSSADAFRAAAGEHGIEIVSEQDIPTGSDDVSDAIAEIDEAGPDIIIVATLEHNSINVVSEAREQGLEQRVVCGNGCNAGTFIEETGDASEGLIVGSAWHIDLENEQNPGFIERYRDMHGADPDQFSAQGYAGIQVLAEAMGDAGSSNPDDIRDALADLGEVETVLGTFSFDENRNGSHPAVIKIVEDGAFEIFQ